MATMNHAPSKARIAIRIFLPGAVHRKHPIKLRRQFFLHLRTAARVLKNSVRM
jgi:hypothetical protein